MKNFETAVQIEDKSVNIDNVEKSPLYNDSERPAEYELPLCSFEKMSDIPEYSDSERNLLGNILPENSGLLKTEINTIESRFLTDTEKAYYKEKLNCSDSIVEGAKINKDGVLQIKTINESKDGIEENSDVKFERNAFEINGVKLEGVFPAFDSKLDVQLPQDMLSETDSKQFKYCNEQLKDTIEKAPDLAEKFSSVQLEQINDLETPDGYTWHHNEELGKMQLVDTDEHQENRHTGGRAVWGGGSESR